MRMNSTYLSENSSPMILLKNGYRYDLKTDK